MLVSSARHSDFIIAISEDDDVCLQANTNLVNYLRYNENINNIYDFSCIGVIPFDERIMEDYGKDRFWKRFQEKTQLSFKIDDERYDFKLEASETAIKVRTISYTRMLRIYGLCSLLIGVLLPLVAQFTSLYYAVSFGSIGTLLSLIGLILIFASSQRFRMFLLGKTDNPRRLKKEVKQE